MSLRILAACALCGYVYERLSDPDEMFRHMAGAHDMRFVTGPFPFRPYWRIISEGDDMTSVSPHP